MAKINPFQPNRPIHPGMFVGRLREVERLEDHLYQARAGYPSSFLLTGERGIGKSSLLLYVEAVADGTLSLNGDRFNFLVIHTDIDQSTSQFGLVRKLELGLRRAIENNEKALSFLRKTWDFIQKIDISGVTIGSKQSNEQPDEALIEESAYCLASTVNFFTSPSLISDFGISKTYDGVLLLIDEADNASPELHLGAFLKLLLERVQRAKCDHFFVGLAGLLKIRDILATSHQSSLRLFEELDLKPLSREETSRVIDLGLEEANRKNARPTTIDAAARHHLITFAEGFPHFIQQFCSSAFVFDDDYVITEDDVLESAFKRGGALDLIGDRYYRDAFYNKIKEESYRQVLRIMAAPKSEWVKKEEIRKAFSGKPKTLDNAIQALTKKNIIVRKEGATGTYRLLHKGFALWILLFTTDREKIKQMSLEEAAQTQSGIQSNDPQGM